MQRPVGAVLVAALVVLAGCSGVFGGSEEPTATLTPAAVPTDEPTPTPAPQLAPGVTGQGIESSLALADAHGSFLRNTSFTTASNTTTVATNGTVLIQRTSTLRAGPNGTGLDAVFERNGSYYPDSVAFPVRTESWSNGEEVFIEQTYANGTATYNRLEVNAEMFRYQIAQGNPELLLGPFDSNTTTVTERFSRNGSTLYRVRGDRRETGQGNVSLRLLVDERGVIHSYRTALESSFNENISHSVTETRFSRIGTTDAPERPSWVDEAMNRTTATEPIETTQEQ